MDSARQDIPSQRDLPSVDNYDAFPPLLAFKNKRFNAGVGEGEATEAQQYEFVCILFCIMVAFFFMAALFEKFKPRCGHQTSYTIIIGIILSMIFFWVWGDSRAEQYGFS